MRGRRDADAESLSRAPPGPHDSREERLSVSTRATIDFGRRTEDYARHRPGPPESFYRRLGRFIRLDGARALDLGTGPGTAALSLAARGAVVVGVDVSTPMIAAASRLAAAVGLQQRAAFRVGSAERTGLPAHSFDLVIALQSWTWFDQDAVLAEVARVLRPGGLLVIAHYSYLPGRSPVAADTEGLILHFNPGWTMAGCDGLYPQETRAVSAAGLELLEQFCYDHLQTFSHESWRGRIRTCNGVGSGAMAPQQVAAFDAELAALLRERYPQEPLLVWHRVWAVVARAPGVPGSSPDRL
jgi:SAM-dependent methyltransferase